MLPFRKLIALVAIIRTAHPLQDLVAEFERHAQFHRQEIQFTGNDLNVARFGQGPILAAGLRNRQPDIAISALTAFNAGHEIPAPFRSRPDL